MNRGRKGEDVLSVRILLDNAPAIPYRHITSNHLLYDLVYNPAETLFLKEGKSRGAAIKNGADMLQLQALAAWDIWTDTE